MGAPRAGPVEYPPPRDDGLLPTLLRGNRPDQPRQKRGRGSRAHIFPETADVLSPLPAAVRGLLAFAIRGP